MMRWWWDPWIPSPKAHLCGFHFVGKNMPQHSTVARQRHGAWRAPRWQTGANKQASPHLLKWWSSLFWRCNKTTGTVQNSKVHTFVFAELINKITAKFSESEISARSPADTGWVKIIKVQRPWWSYPQLRVRAMTQDPVSELHFQSHFWWRAFEGVPVYTGSQSFFFSAPSKRTPIWDPLLDLPLATNCFFEIRIWASWELRSSRGVLTNRMITFRSSFWLPTGFTYKSEHHIFLS